MINCKCAAYDVVNFADKDLNIKLIFYGPFVNINCAIFIENYSV